MVALSAVAPLGPDGAIMFASVLLLSLWTTNRNTVFILAGLVIALVTLDAWMCPFCPSFETAVSERMSTYGVILIASLLLYASPRRQTAAPASQGTSPDTAQADDANAPLPVLSDETGLSDDTLTDEQAQMTAMAHEVRSPLTAIAGFAEMIESELYGPLGDSRYREAASNIQVSAHHILGMTEDYLGLARLQSGHDELHLTRVDIAGIVRNTTAMVDSLALTAYVELKIDLPDDLPDLRADAGKLTQVLLNLLANAIKFTDGGGRVTISALTDFGGHLILVVSDNGIGMTVAETREVMAPFARHEIQGRPREGAGLGLALVNSLVESHDGEFWLESALGIGTRAFVRLPAKHMLKPLPDGARDDEGPDIAPGGIAANGQSGPFNNLSI
jgi:signal transduction histidine kinase